jgi:hypothetical protein
LSSSSFQERICRSSWIDTWLGLKFMISWFTFVHKKGLRYTWYVLEFAVYKQSEFQCTCAHYIIKTVFYKIWFYMNLMVYYGHYTKDKWVHILPITKSFAILHHALQICIGDLTCDHILNSIFTLGLFESYHNNAYTWSCGLFYRYIYSIILKADPVTKLHQYHSKRHSFSLSEHFISVMKKMRVISLWIVLVMLVFRAERTWIIWLITTRSLLLHAKNPESAQNISILN